MKSFLENDFLYDRYKNVEELIGIKDTSEPSIVNFKNSDMACELLKNAINKGIKIIIHGDVDVDGIGVTKILSTFVLTISPYHNIRYCINKDKVHGISGNHVKYFNNIEDCLIVILDSGTNNIEHIKQIRHNVLVVDHHDISVGNLTGRTADGEYCIVNNMTEDSDGIIHRNMSAGLVMYELLRYMQKKFGMSNILEDKLLYQWAVITLFTDVIDNDDKRNLYYIDKTLGNNHVEQSLRVLMDRICPYNKGFEAIDKSFISFSLAPTFNRAIRAGYSSNALNIAVVTPQKVADLLSLKQYEAELLSNYLDDSVNKNGYVIKDVTGGIGKNYCGLMASKLLDHYRDSAICYIRVNDKFEGSFRGGYQDIDYRKLVAELGYFAQGHGPAFGFKVPVNELSIMMDAVVHAEKTKEHRDYLTAGNIPDEHKGIYHLTSEDIVKFKQLGWAWKIGLLNSKISNTSSCVSIVVHKSDITITAEYEKRTEYDCLGFKGCVSFEAIESEYVYLYIEFGKELKFYLRNKWK